MPVFHLNLRLYSKVCMDSCIRYLMFSDFKLWNITNIQKVIENRTSIYSPCSLLPWLLPILFNNTTFLIQWICPVASPQIPVLPPWEVAAILNQTYSLSSRRPQSRKEVARTEPWNRSWEQGAWDFEHWAKAFGFNAVASEKLLASLSSSQKAVL